MAKNQSIRLSPKPCPKCGWPVKIFGSECYPEDGITIQCTQESCSYYLTMIMNYRSDDLKQRAIIAHNLKGKKI
jgi:hypothetical protein